MKEFRFQDFRVYQEAKELHKQVVIATKSFSFTDRYISDQMRRAALSIALNIAEGSAKTSDKDFRRYLENSLGSVNELIAALEIADDLGLIRDSETVIVLATSVKRQLGGFAKKLKVGG